MNNISTFVKLLKDGAKLEAENAPTGEKGRPLWREALQGFLLRRNIARLSFARIRAITRRIIGATVHHQRAIGVWSTQPGNSALAN